MDYKDYKNYKKYKNKYIELKQYLARGSGVSELKIFVISFNEGEFDSYEYDNKLNELLDIIKKDTPDIINIATQEYKNDKNNSNTNHNGMLINFIKNELGFHNCDTDECKKIKIYSSCGEEKIFDEKIKCTKSFPQELYADTISNTFINKNTVKLIEINENIMFVDDSVLGYNLKKRLIMTECKIIKNSIENTIYFINAHLPFGSKNDFKYKYRIINFKKIIREFDLYKKYIDGFPIFISGDLNFRFHILENGHIMNPDNKDNTTNQLEKIKQYYSLPYTDDKKTDKKNMFELYNYLSKLDKLSEVDLVKKISKTINDHTLIKKFVKDLQDSLYMDFPTCRYNEERKEFINEKFNQISNDQMLFYKKNTKEPRFPSNCDQIIFIINKEKEKYIVSNNKISIIDISKKSDHLGIYRQVTLKHK